MIPGPFGAHRVAFRRGLRFHAAGPWGFDTVEEALAGAKAEWTHARRGRAAIAFFEPTKAVERWADLIEQGVGVAPTYFAIGRIDMPEDTEAASFEEVEAFGELAIAARRADALREAGDEDVVVVIVWMDAEARAYLANGASRRKGRGP